MPEHLNDKILTLKTTMLLALTFSTRAHEIGSLNIGFLVKLPNTLYISLLKNYENCKGR